jgi:hypothetical protein
MAVFRLYEAWPVVIWVFDGDPIDQDTDFLLKHFTEVLSRKQPYASIIWIKKASRNRHSLQRIAAWFKENQDASDRFNIGAAIINTSPIFRFILSSFMLITAPKSKPEVCDSYPKAAKWIKERLELHELSCPEGLLTFDLEKLSMQGSDTPLATGKK